MNIQTTVNEFIPSPPLSLISSETFAKSLIALLAFRLGVKPEDAALYRIQTKVN